MAYSKDTGCFWCDLCGKIMEANWSLSTEEQVVLSCNNEHHRVFFTTPQVPAKEETECHGKN
jgi:hypothetical protein